MSDELQKQSSNSRKPDDSGMQQTTRKGSRKPEENVSRRRLLKTTTQVGALALTAGSGLAVGAEVLPQTPKAFADVNPNVVNLPLNMSTTSGFELFLEALSDQKIRAGLSKTKSTLPQSAYQLLMMMDDQHFMQMGMTSGEVFGKFLHGKATLAQVQDQSSKLHAYLNEQYPGGYSSLNAFATQMFPQFENKAKILDAQVQKVLKGDFMGSATNPENPDFSFLSPSASSNAQSASSDGSVSPDCFFAVSPCVAANAAVVVNAVVYTNAAVATLAVAAAAVCIVIAVCPAVSTDVCVSVSGTM